MQRFLHQIFERLPTSNHHGIKRQARLQPLCDRLQALNLTMCGSEERLYATVYYFNHAGFHQKQDIQNVIKPLLDTLEKRVYPNDKQVCEFSGTRLDLKYSKEWFEVEYRPQQAPGIDLVELSKRGGYVIEVGSLPTKNIPILAVTWREK